MSYPRNPTLLVRWRGSRRRVLQALVFAPLGVASCATSGAPEPVPEGGLDGGAAPDGPTVDLAAGSTDAVAPSDGPLELTPSCAGHTPPQTEGPYWTPSSPERASLRESGSVGTILVLEGQVLSRDCKPIVRALVDLWQCDQAGVYDNSGFRLRGHVYTGNDGRYRFETILPGLYPGRTRHLHVKVQAPDRAVLTTQLYFPDEPANARDSLYQAALLVKLAPNATGKTARFDFVLNA